MPQNITSLRLLAVKRSAGCAAKRDARRTVGTASRHPLPALNVELHFARIVFPHGMDTTKFRTAETFSLNKLIICV